MMPINVFIEPSRELISALELKYPNIARLLKGVQVTIYADDWQQLARYLRRAIAALTVKRPVFHEDSLAEPFSFLDVAARDCDVNVKVIVSPVYFGAVRLIARASDPCGGESWLFLGDRELYTAADELDVKKLERVLTDYGIRLVIATAFGVNHWDEVVDDILYALENGATA